MKKIISIVLITFIVSCTVETSENVQPNVVNLKNDCTEQFNDLFMEIFENNLNYEIKSAELYNPQLIPNFYSKREIETFCFFKLSNDSSEFIVAIDTVNTKGQHNLYFCFDFKEHKFIDQSSSVIGNFDFLSNCEINLRNKSNLTNNGWTTNLWDYRMMGKWKLDSTDGKSKFSEIEFTKKKIIVDEIDTIPYYQVSFELFKSQDSTLIFERQALSNKKLILKQSVDDIETYYYLNKN